MEGTWGSKERVESLYQDWINYNWNSHCVKLGNYSYISHMHTENFLTKSVLKTNSVLGILNIYILSDFNISLVVERSHFVCDKWLVFCVSL